MRLDHHVRKAIRDANAGETIAESPCTLAILDRHDILRLGAALRT